MNELQPARFSSPPPQPLPAEPAITARDLALIAWRRLWLIALVVGVSTLTAAFLSKRTPPAWRATAQVLLVQRAPIMATTPQAIANAPMVESIDTQITLLQSRKLAEEAAPKAGVNADVLMGASTITPRKDGDNVIDLAVEADSREHAVAWAKALCETFIEYKNHLAQSGSEQDLQQLEVQAAQAKKQVAAADRKLLDFQQSHHVGGIGVLDPVQQKTAALNAVLAQDALIAGFRNDNIAAQANAANLQRQLEQGKQVIAASHTVRDDSQTRALQTQLADLKQKRFEYRQHVTARPGSPGALQLDQYDGQITLLQARLNQAIQASQSQPSLEAQEALKNASDTAQSTARSAQIKLDAAIAEGTKLKQNTVDLPRLSLEAQNLVDADTQAHAQYNNSSAAVQAAQLDKDTASGNVQIVQPAYAPEAPFRPDPNRDMALGFGIGLILALLAVLLMEQTDSSVRTAADVRRLVDGPVVAVLPQMTRSERGQFAGGSRPPHLIETYNAARANLGLAMRQRTGVNLDDHQVILVTSALPGEGKSLTASELAQSYARAGRRVILVNADMRRPSALMQGKTGKEAGLAEVLAGSLKVEDALQQSQTPNLSMLHGGHAAENPIDLISQPRMAETIQALREAADVVIIDSPPASVVADALLIAPHADCVLYVVGVGIVDSDNMRNTAGALAAAAPKMLAYFVNRVPRLVGEPANYSYAGYGRTTFAPSPVDMAGGGPSYQPNRTVFLQREPDGDLSGNTGASAVVTPARLPLAPDEHFSGNGTPGLSNGARSSLRVVPRTGSSLVTLAGPYTGQSFALSPDKSLTLGTRPDCDIVLARDETISQVHAHIAPEDTGFVVYDVSSTNGTLVNDKIVTRHVLEVGDVLQIGASRFRYE